MIGFLFGFHHTPSHTAHVPSLPSFEYNFARAPDYFSATGRGTRDRRRVFLTLAVPGSRGDAKTMTSAWQLIKTGLHIFFASGGQLCAS